MDNASTVVHHTRAMCQNGSSDGAGIRLAAVLVYKVLQGRNTVRINSKSFPWDVRGVQETYFANCNVRCPILVNHVLCCLAIDKEEKQIDFKTENK